MLTIVPFYLGMIGFFRTLQQTETPEILQLHESAVIPENRLHLWTMEAQIQRHRSPDCGHRSHNIGSVLTDGSLCVMESLLH